MAKNGGDANDFKKEEMVGGLTTCPDNVGGLRKVSENLKVLCFNSERFLFRTSIIHIF